MDIFEGKSISPMLIGESRHAFDSSDYIYELKLDGIRCIAYLWTDGLELQNKHNKRLNSIYPELKQIFRQANARCILDGELVILKDGKPDFFSMQRRSLMSNAVKIDIAAKKQPVCFTAFDILYLKDKSVTEMPLIERKELLSKTIIESQSLALARYIKQQGIALYNAAEQQELEGIVAKKIDSRYYLGKRTKDWIKIKSFLDEDFIVCGYYLKKENIVSVILGSFLGNEIIYQSHVVMGVSRNDFNIMTQVKRTDKRMYKNFPDFENAIWLTPKLVCRVQYMERTPGGGLRQPIFKGLRDDKAPTDCIYYVTDN